MKRRHLLHLSLGGAALLTAGAWTLRRQAPIWERPSPAEPAQPAQLHPLGHRLVACVAEAVLDGAWPSAGPLRDQALARHTAAFEDVLRGFPPAVQAEVADLLAVAVHAPALLGLPRLDAPTPAWTEALQGLRHSRLNLRCQAYCGLRDLNLAAHFAQPAAWAWMGYPGPQAVHAAPSTRAHPSAPPR